jgi:mRNA-degrading endonuclease RelE of RelBE toxin-antitoxin system
VSDQPWRLALTARAQRDTDRLPTKIAPAIAGFLTGGLLDNPQRLGKHLRRELTGYLSARRGDYRILYRPDTQAHTVVVVRVSHRADAYRGR